MRRRSLKHALALSCLLVIAMNAAAQEKAAKSGPFADADHVVYTPPRGARSGSLNKANLLNHGGPVIPVAKAVLIFWGPSFAAGGADNAYATTLQAFRNQLGTTPEYNVITQYSGIMLTNLGSGTGDLFDTTLPPVKVTDAISRSEVSKYLTTHAFNASTVYVVVLPSSSYAASGSSTSCGGPNLAFCAYHGNFLSGSNDVRYIVLPWPGCAGCRVSGWSNVQNAEHFLVHEIRESVTDPDLNCWFDSAGNEADDKCAWSPAPFIGTGGYAYQYEWSNATASCVKTR